MDNDNDPLNRVLAEQRKTTKLLEEIEVILSSEKELVGLSLKGGIKTLIRRLREEKEKVFQLKREVDKINRSK